MDKFSNALQMYVTTCKNNIDLQKYTYFYYVSEFGVCRLPYQIALLIWENLNCG